MRFTADEADDEIEIGFRNTNVFVLGRAFGFHDVVGKRERFDAFQGNHVGIGHVRVDRRGYQFAVREGIDVADGGIELVFGIAGKIPDRNIDRFSGFEYGHSTGFEESLRIGHRFRCGQDGIGIVGRAVGSNCE